MQREHDIPRTSDTTKLIVVEVANYCVCHTVVTARKQDEPDWVFFCVKNPKNITFGDTLLIEGRLERDCIIDKAWLYRGPNLMYSLVLDNLPPELLPRLMEGRVSDE